MKEPKKGDIVSVVLYLEVEKVNKDNILTKDIFTEEKVNISRNYIPFFRDGTKYVKVVKTTRTDLVGILTKCTDEIYTATYTKLNGKKRILTGKTHKVETNMGRTLAWDLRKKGPRYIDHRTLESIIVGNIKYMLKDEYKKPSRLVESLQ